MSLTDQEARQAVERAKKFLTSFEESAVIDQKALELAHNSDKAKGIEAAADELVAEMARIGCSPILIRYVRATYVVVLVEKIQLAERGGASCRSN